MLQTSLHMRYKGNRNYLNGSDFCTTIQESLERGNPGWLRKITFKSFARKQCDVFFEKPQGGLHTIGTGIWQQDSGERKFWIVESSRPITERYSFDEDLLLSQAIIIDEKIKVVKNNSFSVIENIVALSKRLNYHLIPHIAGKWVFGQADFNKKLPSEFSSIKIELHSSVQSRFSRNIIEIDGLRIGEIRFIVGEP